MSNAMIRFMRESYNDIGKLRYTVQAQMNLYRNELFKNNVLFLDVYGDINTGWAGD